MGPNVARNFRVKRYCVATELRSGQTNPLRNVWHVQPIFSDGSAGSYITNSDDTDHLNHFEIASSRSNAYAIEHNSEEFSNFSPIKPL